MIAVLSPAKTLDFGAQCLTKKHSTADFLEDSQQLATKLKKTSKPKLKELMGISDKLAELNAQRYRDWSLPFTEENAKQALLAFKGDVYTGFECEEWKVADFTFAQRHLRILSGLYGILRPLDLMQAYRLEMGTDLSTRRGRNLYDFWGEKITGALNEALAEARSKVLVNLASNEYFSAVQPTALNAEVVTPVFKDFKNGTYKFMSFYGKKARGMMADFIVRQRVKKAEDLKAFNTAGYYFDPESSGGGKMTFLRDAAQ